MLSTAFHCIIVHVAAVSLGDSGGTSRPTEHHSDGGKTSWVDLRLAVNGGPGVGGLLRGGEGREIKEDLAGVL